jgi:PPP family 3-phenylpropionic acid transporter
MTHSAGETAAQASPPAFAARMALLYCAMFSFAGLMLPFFPLWLKERGLDATQIALVLSLPLAVRVLTSGYVSAWADRVPERADVLIGLMGGTAICFAVFPFAGGFWGILAVALVLAFFSHPLQPVMDSITLSGVRRFGHDYGRIRVWGSVIFIFANFAGGWLLGAHGTGAIMAAMIATAFVGFAISPLTPRLGRPRRAASQNQLASPSTWKLLANTRFMLVTAGCGIVQATHAMIYGFGSIHWETVGFSGNVIGLFWAIGVFAEIVLFQFSSQVLRRVSPVQLILIGAFAALIRWTLFPLEPGLAGFAALQVLHGLSFGATHLGLMHYYNDAVPEERMGSAQAAGFVTGAIAMGAFGLASGPLYQAFGVNAFLAMALAGAFGLGLLLMAGRVHPQSLREGGETLPPE